MVEVQFKKKKRGRGRGETNSWSNGIDVCGGSFIEVYGARASGMGDGEALDRAAAGKVAAGDGRDDNLLYVSISASLSLFLAIPLRFLFERCEMGITHRNTARIVNV
jgi:hypothetical protein